MTDVEGQIAAFLHEEGEKATPSAEMFQRVIRESRIRRLLTGVAVLAVIVVSAIVSVQAVRSPVSTGPVSHEEKNVFFPTVARSEAYPGALIRGVLEQREDCLYVSDESSLWLVLWPEGYSAIQSGVGIEIRDDSGNIVGRTEEEITLGGGEINPGGVGGRKKADQIVDRLVLEEIPDRCKSDLYWLASPS